MSIDFAKTIQGEPQEQKAMVELDAEKACQILKMRYEPKIKQFVELAKKHEITDEATYELAIEFAAQAKRLVK